MLTLTINIEGDGDSDLEYALEEVARLVRLGCTSGNNSNGTGNFNFDITGEAKKDPPIVIGGRFRVLDTLVNHVYPNAPKVAVGSLCKIIERVRFNENKNIVSAEDDDGWHLYRVGLYHPLTHEAQGEAVVFLVTAADYEMLD